MISLAIASLFFSAPAFSSTNDLWVAPFKATKTMGNWVVAKGRTVFTFAVPGNMTAFVGAKVLLSSSTSATPSYDLYLSVSSDGLPHDDYMAQESGLRASLTKNQLTEVDVSSVMPPEVVPGMEYITLQFKINGDIYKKVRVIGLRYQYEGAADTADSEGPPGPPGPAGPQGEKGDKGDQGPPGFGFTAQTCPECSYVRGFDADGNIICQYVPALPEVCDGLDNNCDGLIDNDLPEFLCGNQSGVCSGSTQVCGGSSGWLTCTSTEYGPNYEDEEVACDGVDNDCDGVVDETVFCPLTVGVCADSTTSCLNGSRTTCDYGPAYQAEEALFDLLDNDCDGGIDETVIDAEVTADQEHNLITMGADGLPVIVYRSPAGIRMARCTDSSCGGLVRATIAFGAFDPSHFCASSGSFSLATGGDGLPVVAYVYDYRTEDTPCVALPPRESYRREVVVAHCDDSDCASVTHSVVAEFVPAGENPSMAIGADGLPVVVYTNSSYWGEPLELKMAHCLDMACTSSTHAIIDAPGGGLIGLYTSITAGADGFPAIAYTYAEGGGGMGQSNVLRVAHCDSPGCTSSTISTVESSAHKSLWNAIAIGADGLPAIAYVHRPEMGYQHAELRFAHCEDVACSSSSIITMAEAPLENRSLTLAIGADGLAVTAYHEWGADQKVYAVRCNDIACTSATSFPVAYAGGNSNSNDYSSIAIGADGLPILTFLEADRDELWVVKAPAP